MVEQSPKARLALISHLFKVEGLIIYGGADPDKMTS